MDSLLRTKVERWRGRHPRGLDLDNVNDKEDEEMDAPDVDMDLTLVLG